MKYAFQYLMTAGIVWMAIVSPCSFAQEAFEDDFSQETVGDTLNTLANWSHEGTLGHGRVVDQGTSKGKDPAIRFTFPDGRGPNIYRDVDMTAGPGYTTLTVEFELVEDKGDNWFGLFVTSHKPGDKPGVYRWQWNPGASEHVIVLQGNPALVKSKSDLSGTHKMKLTIAHDPDMQENTLIAWVDGQQVMQTTDLSGQWVPSEQTRITFIAIAGNTVSEVDDVKISLDG